MFGEMLQDVWHILKLFVTIRTIIGSVTLEVPLLDVADRLTIVVNRHNCLKSHGYVLSIAWFAHITSFTAASQSTLQMPYYLTT